MKSSRSFRPTTGPTSTGHCDADRGRTYLGPNPAHSHVTSEGTAVGQVVDLLRRILPHLLRIGLFALIALVVIELLIAVGIAILQLLENPGVWILIGLIWWWKRRRNRFL